ncbi:hypothetical protein ROA7450_03967 [Roseovarius albus]|uniref:DUF3095 domain-containing protein n=1 Tax=Roseovarius albus TaxID=1247867 RepID=A0A1X7A6J1_9RHOB|nr:DUF3095 domain-containing protein [Roseovarius albus]SLN71841.1 hypothetical protein ROA7450_03967 [Roseovarius albus]
MTDQPSNLNFYSDLKAFKEFSEIDNPSHFHALPDDWVLLVSDVVNSTSAIENGKYKSVNMVGAASITAVINIAGDVKLPFAFGGDGGLIAVPPDLLQSASREMTRLQAASVGLFDLSLRAAAIPVAALRDAGADTLVAKYQLSAGNDLAMFAGQGVTTADQWLKSDEIGREYALIPGAEEEFPNLEGLSCRWEPLKARNGTMLTTIIASLSKQDDSTTGFTEPIVDILDGELSNFAPAHGETLRFRFPPTGLPFEIAAASRHSKWLARTIWTHFTAFMQYFCERFSIKVGDYDGAIYRDELISNTDYRKYDGALRMVLDVSREQADKIEAYLEGEFRAGRLIYGTWRADSALMTCLLFDLSESQHVHFIDGANGGYAMAAKALKRRINERQNDQRSAVR